MSSTSKSSRHIAAATVLAALLSVGIGWLDLHVTEVAVTIMALLLAGLLLGFVAPRRAWRRALLLALGLPAVAEAARLLRLPTAGPIRIDPRIVLAAFAFALAGSFGGAAARRIVRG